MAGSNPLDVRGFLQKSTAKASLEDLQKKGVTKVRVLDQRTLERLIHDSVQKVLSGRAGMLSETERQQIYQDSRRELDRLMREFGQMKSQAEAASTDRDTLLREFQNLQEQLKVQRTMYEEKLRMAEAKAADPAQLQEAQAKLTYAQEQNKYLESKVRELDEAVRKASGASPQEVQAAFQQGVQSQERYIGELKERIQALEEAKTAATVADGALAEKMAGLDQAIADRLSKLFSKTVEGLNRKIASIKGGVGGVGTDDVEYRASEAVLDNLLKEEIQSNLGNVVSEQKVSGSMEDRLAKLKNLQKSFGGKKKDDKKDEEKKS